MVDGDTYVISVNLGFDCSISITGRLHGVDCPEYTKAKCKEEKRLALEAMGFVNSEISDRYLEIHSRMKDKYGRYVLNILYEKPENTEKRVLSLSEQLIKSGHSMKVSYCNGCSDYSVCTNKIRI
jgi:endonuclease YncB( thermonuclease family)